MGPPLCRETGVSQTADVFFSSLDEMQVNTQFASMYIYIWIHIYIYNISLQQWTNISLLGNMFARKLPIEQG